MTKISSKEYVNKMKKWWNYVHKHHNKRPFTIFTIDESYETKMIFDEFVI